MLFIHDSIKIYTMNTCNFESDWYFFYAVKNSSVILNLYSSALAIFSHVKMRGWLFKISVFLIFTQHSNDQREYK